MNTNLINVQPNAASLIESMRSIGYSFEMAISDIIDNSISAKATSIKIYCRKINSNPYIQIIDNGRGMSNIDLIEAMRLGSKNPNKQREKHDLGRFGLGLKSASFSQCRVLTVISKTDKEINGYQWDLDLIQKIDRFDVIKMSPKDIKDIPNIEELELVEYGTIVQWTNFDRILSSSQDFDNEMSLIMNRTIDHISLIFHRYIEDGLEISVNLESINAKDPFLTHHAGTQELKTKKIKVDGETIWLYPFVLPHYSTLKVDDQRKSGKISEHYKSQGFYLYRNKRLIIWGDYLGLARKSELGKNVRIRVDIPNSLDYLWEIDVKKSRANVPSKIKKNLLSVISDGDMASKKVNTYRGKRELTKDKPLWLLCEDRENEFYFEINNNHDMYLQLASVLNDDQKSLMNLFLKSLAASIPVQTIYSQISGGSINQSYDDKLITDISAMLQQLKESRLVKIDEWLKTLLSEEPFKSNENVVKYINKELRCLNV